MVLVKTENLLNRIAPPHFSLRNLESFGHDYSVTGKLTTLLRHYSNIFIGVALSNSLLQKKNKAPITFSDSDFF